jgi:hypothetical protein
MRHTGTDYPFDTDNRAWRRFLDLVGEHFEVIGWNNADTGRPTLTTLIDIGSGDAFTVAILDSIEMREPYTLIASTIDGQLAAYGPFDGETAAGAYAPQLALADVTVAATRPTPLHHPSRPALPDDAWLPVPTELARLARPAPGDAHAAALILLDRDAALLTVVGPFATQHAADIWRPTPDPYPGADRLIVALRPAGIDGATG